jgi:starvation-inducible DNA-binding protein
MLKPTKNDLPASVRSKMVELLNARLADAIDLFSQLKHAHWNVKGPGFIALHKLFDEVAEDVEGYVDELAERAVQLGGVAEGSVHIVSSRSTLSPYPAKADKEREHVEAVASALATFGKSVRSAIDVAASAPDADTADLFTDISRGVDQWLWFVEAHLG